MHKPLQPPALQVARWAADVRPLPRLPARSCVPRPRATRTSRRRAEAAGADEGSWVLLAPPPSRSGKGKAKATPAAPPSKRPRSAPPSAAEQVANMSEAEKAEWRRALGM